MNLKTINKKEIHDCESRTKGVKKQILNELSTPRVDLISQYEMEITSPTTWLKLERGPKLEYDLAMIPRIVRKP
jgi:hypothetical protein